MLKIPSTKLGDGTNLCRRLFSRRREFEFEGNIFFLEELGIGMQTDSQTPTYFALSKTVCIKMSRKSKDKGSANEENKHFDPCGKGGEPQL